MQDEEVSLDWRFSGALPELARISLRELKRFHDEARRHFNMEIAKLEKRATEMAAADDDTQDYLAEMYAQWEGLLDLKQEFGILGLFRTLERFLGLVLIHLREIGAPVSERVRFSDMAKQFKKIGVDLKASPFQWSEITKLQKIRNLIAHEEAWVDKETKKELASFGLAVNENDWLKLPDGYFLDAWKLVDRTCQSVVQECLKAEGIGKFRNVKEGKGVRNRWDKDNHPREVRTLKVRVNANDGTSRELDENPAAWCVPADQSVDLAAMPVNMPDGLLIAVIPIDNFATKDFMTSNQIAEGSPILLSGYFYQFPGERRFQSIVRQGILSMVPDEPVTTTTGKPGTVYLCDVHIFNGNSGSPVVVTADWLGVGGYHFLGVVSGLYFEDEDFNLEIATTVKGKAQANSGVAMVVPADLVKALLDGPQLKGSREAYFSRPAGH